MKRVILGQLGWAYDSEVYLPLSAGMLAAHCNADECFRAHYEIDPWLRFARGEPQAIVDGFAARDGSGPAVVGLSHYVWCQEINYAVLKLVRERWPHCTTVLGGPSTGDPGGAAEALLRAHSEVDVLVHGEGEAVFLDLIQKTAGGYWSRVAGISFLAGHDLAAPYIRTAPWPREKDLDRFPSPFLDGTFDRLLATPAGKEVKFAGVWEPDRGCPFACT